MPISISLDTSKLVKRLDDMQATLKKLGTQDIGNELHDWQAEDLHRKKPFQRVWARGKRASTVIRPHSLAELKHTHKRLLRASRRKGGRGPSQHRSARPILRQELYDKLVERVSALLATVKW